MSKVIMVGCDLHQRTMVLRFCAGTAQPEGRTFENTTCGRERMVSFLRNYAKAHKSSRIVLVYEASSLGFGLSDFLFDRKIECHVLSPTHIEKSASQMKRKTDDADALMLLEKLRGHMLAGNSLPVCWTPPQRLRDDRELVRARVDASDETSRIKLKILSMLKRHGIERPARFSSWTKSFITWLRECANSADSFVSPVLLNLIDLLEANRKNEMRLSKVLGQLAKTDRYRTSVEELRKLPGVGLMTAMTFLTEMGDLKRFANRREVAAYLGLCPSCHESGEANDRKGRITRQGPSRVRKLLCQAAWVAVRRCPDTSKDYERIKSGKKKHAKKALVAIMRRLAIKMWHRAQEFTSAELQGRGGPRSLQAAYGKPAY